jgi:hypothetical protein
LCFASARPASGLEVEVCLVFPASKLRPKKKYLQVADDDDDDDDDGEKNTLFAKRMKETWLRNEAKQKPFTFVRPGFLFSLNSESMKTKIKMK